MSTVHSRNPNVAPTLMEMHDLGVLGRFVPEFGRLTCKCSMIYHPFTADVHASVHRYFRPNLKETVRNLTWKLYEERKVRTVILDSIHSWLSKTKDPKDCEAGGTRKDFDAKIGHLRRNA